MMNGSSARYVSNVSGAVVFYGAVTPRLETFSDFLSMRNCLFFNSWSSLG